MASLTTGADGSRRIQFVAPGGKRHTLRLGDTPKKLAESVAMTFRNQTRNTTRAAMALGHALDMADHYSQLANYMRLNNILPPTALPRPTQ